MICLEITKECPEGTFHARCEHSTHCMEVRAGGKHRGAAQALVAAAVVRPFFPFPLFTLTV